MEFVLVEHQCLLPAGLHDVPEGHIRVPCRQADGGGAGDHERRRDCLGRGQAQLFLELTQHRGARMLARLHMAAGGQP